MSAGGSSDAVPGAPRFPPAFAGHAVAAGGDPMREAFAAAVAGTHGAGDLFWSTDTDRAAAAFVLEPEVPLARAIEMAPTLMVAIGDALGAIGPPNLALTYRWPTSILANGGIVGKVLLAAPDDPVLADIPRFLVVGHDLALGIGANGAEEPGLQPDMTALHEEGCGGIDRTMLVEAVARHFLSWIDTWQQDGFGSVHHSWLARAHDLGAVFEWRAGGRTHRKTMIGLDENGGLLARSGRGVVCVPLAKVLGIGR